MKSLLPSGENRVETKFDFLTPASGIERALPLPLPLPSESSSDEESTTSKTSCRAREEGRRSTTKAWPVESVATMIRLTDGYSIHVRREGREREACAHELKGWKLASTTGASKRIVSCRSPVSRSQIIQAPSVEDERMKRELRDQLDEGKNEDRQLSCEGPSPAGRPASHRPHHTLSTRFVWP